MYVLFYKTAYKYICGIMLKIMYNISLKKITMYKQMILEIYSTEFQ